MTARRVVTSMQVFGEFIEFLSAKSGIRNFGKYPYVRWD